MKVKHLPLYYLASPYTHKSKKVMFSRFKEISSIAGKLLKRGYLVLTPISSSVPIAKYGGIHGTDFSDWATLDLNMVRKSDGLIVAMMDGWKESVGVQAEIAYAKRLKKDVKFFNPKTGRFLKRKA